MVSHSSPLKDTYRSRSDSLDLDDSFDLLIVQNKIVPFIKIIKDTFSIQDWKKIWEHGVQQVNLRTFNSLCWGPPVGKWRLSLEEEETGGMLICLTKICHKLS